MATRVYKLFGNNAAAATANANAQVIIQRNGFITAIHISSQFPSAVNGDNSGWEISTSSAGQLNTNDAVGPLLQINQYNKIAAAGSYEGVQCSKIEGIAISLAAGDRLYLNYSGTAATSYCWCYVYVTEK